MLTILVIGASGMLGQLVCKELVRIPEEIHIIVSDYKADRGTKTAESIAGAEFRQADARNPESIRSALAGVNAVIVVAKQEEPLVQQACIERGIACVDVTTEAAFVNKVRQLDAPNIGSIVMAGFFPGLSGLMVKEAAEAMDALEEVNVALLQSTNAQAGATGVSDMLHIVAQDVEGRAGFKEARQIAFGSSGLEREVRKIEHAERGCISEAMNLSNLHYWTAWNEASFNKKISLLKKLGLLKWLANRKGLLEKIVIHNPNQNERAYLTVEASGRIEGRPQVNCRRVSVVSDYETTAMVAVALAKIVLKNEIKGVRYPFEATNLTELMDTIQSDHIVLK
ncbi:NmrA family NAD(P)-binding protein [Paenibacillus senegalensis]|uniref:NmrA family NAD(P)-binding protein n=1 Tax=Paenibacillus senegalensis TaxID=1465766 RepID=UPI000289DA4B|nr:NmrA family NAD(P)-binding protein [Paenibacillus senegalensis]